MRILIAEDEALQRRALEHLILQIEPGAVIIGAADGLEALSQVRQHAPDCVFMDIRMPRLDGIEAARRIRETAPDACVFFLTAYEQFTYAQQAVGLGADDYLLKPVSPADLRRCLAMTADRLREQAASREREEGLRQMIADALPLLRAQFVRDLCAGTIMSNGEYRRRAGLLQAAQEPDMAVSVGFGAGMSAEQASGAGQISREIEHEVLRRQATAAVEESVGASLPGSVVARVAHDELVVLVAVRALRVAGKRPAASLRRMIARMVEHCSDSGLEIAVGLGDVVTGPLTLWRSYRAAVRARQRAWLLGPQRHRVVQAADLGEDHDQWSRYPLLAERGLIEAVRSGLVSQARGYLEELVAYFANGYGPPPEGDAVAVGMIPLPTARSRAVECLALLARAASEGGLPADRALAHNGAAIDGAMRATTAETLSEVVMHHGLALAEMVAGHQDQRQSGLAARAAAYLEGHFPEEISLTAIAEELHISPFYLSHVFRQSMGITFSEYLTRVRVEEAKRLLASTDLPVGEIAARVGYREPNYFGRVFKKATGQTPLAWRRER